MSKTYLSHTFNKWQKKTKFKSLCLNEINGKNIIP